MKLFGNTHGTAASRRENSMSGRKKGLIILGILLVVLVIAAVAVWKLVVKPPLEGTIDSSNAQSIIDRVEGTDTAVPPEPEPEPERQEAPAEPTEGPEETQEEEEEELPDEPEEEEVGEAVETDDGKFTILLCGIDKGGTNTDTMMLASFDLNEKKLSIVSVPRDTMDVTASGGTRKLNSTYIIGGGGTDGMEYLAAKLATMFSIPINAYALIDLTAFVEVVDLIGGVWFDVPQNMNYEDPYQDLYIHLTAGYQLLDGEKSMQLVRFRSYPMGDIQRVSVQQDFLRTVIDQSLSVGNLTKVNEVARIISENLTTNLTLGNLVYLGSKLLSVTMDDISFYTMPGTPVTYNSASYYVLYRSDVLELLNDCFNPSSVELTEEDMNFVYVSNGTVHLTNGRSFSSGVTGGITYSAGSTTDISSSDFSGSDWSTVTSTSSTVSSQTETRQDTAEAEVPADPELWETASDSVPEAEAAQPTEDPTDTAEEAQAQKIDRASVLFDEDETSPEPTPAEAESQTTAASEEPSDEIIFE